MDSQSTASAASTSSRNTPRVDSIEPSSPVQSSSGASHDSDVHILNAPAAIQWQSSSGEEQAQLQCLGRENGARVSVDCHLDLLSNTAFCSFHTRVVLKALPFSKTNIYLWLPPERVLGITLNEQAEGVIIDGKKQTAVGLHFELDEPAALVGPRLSLTPRNKKHGDTLALMRSLAAVKRFSLYLQSRTASIDELRQLCRAFAPVSASGSSVTARAQQSQRTRPTMMKKYAYIANLYKGHGGLFITGGFEVASDPGQPPEYDQIEPGPPLPPLDDSELRRDKQIEHLHPSKKRRRASSFSEAVMGHKLADSELGGMLSALREELRTELRQEFQEKLDEVKLEFKRQLEQIRHESETHWADAQATFWSAEELPDAVADVIDTEIEQVKSVLRDHIDQELDEAEIRIEENVKNNIVDSLEEASLHLTLP